MSQISCGNAEIDARLAALMQDGIHITLFSVPFRLRFEFTGAVQHQTAGAMVVFTGEAALSDPFRLRAQVRLALDAKGRYDLRFTLPDLGAALAAFVRPKLSGDAARTYDALVAPYVAFYRNCTVVLASSAGDDPKLGGILAGINFYVDVRMGDVEPMRSLCKTFPQAGLQDRHFVLHTGCIASPAFTFVIEGTAMLAAELGTPSAVLDRLVMRLDQDTRSVAASTAAFFRVRVGGEELVFIGALGIDSDGRVMISGSLDAADGAWDSPFGARGLTVTNLGVQIMAAAKPPYVGFGLRGGVRFGSDSAKGVDLALLVDPTDPMKCVLDLFIPGGFDLQKIVAACVDPKYVPAELVSMKLDDVRIFLSPNGGVIAGKEFDPGFALAGELELWGWRGAVDGRLTYASGGSLSGAMSPLRFPADGWLVDIRGNEGEGPEVHIDFHAARQAAKIDAAVKIVGKYNHQARVVADPSRLEIELGKTQLGLYTGGKLVVGRGQIELGAAVGFHVPELVVPLGVETIRFSADVDAQYKALGTVSQVGQSVRFAFDALGTRIAFDVNAGAVRFEEVDSMVRFFMKQGDRIAQLMLGHLALVTTAALQWLRPYMPDANDVARVLRTANAAANRVAGGLRHVYALADTQCSLALRHGGYTTTQIAGALQQAYALTEQQVCRLLDQAGFPPKEIATAMRKAFDWSAKATAKFFDDALGYSDKVTHAALDAAGYAEKEIRGAMEDAYGWTSSVWDDFVGMFG